MKPSSFTNNVRRAQAVKTVAPKFAGKKPKITKTGQSPKSGKDGLC